MIDLSIVIATYNRRDLLRRCLDALSRQRYPADRFEVVVVVDGSTDGTVEMLNRYTGLVNLSAIRQGNQGPAVARNVGIKRAVGEYILFLDDDIILEPSCISEHVNAQREREGIVGVGRITIKLAKHADGFTRWFASWWNGHYQRLERDENPKWIDCYSGNLSVPASAVEQIGGFVEDLSRGEDVELGYRLLGLGLPVVYLPHAMGHQTYVKRARDILFDAKKQGASSIQLYQRHPAMLPDLPLARFGEATWRAAFLRSLLLSIRAPALIPIRIGDLDLNERWQNLWYAFAHNYAFWMGVRRAAPNEDMWRRLTSGTCILMYHGFAARGEGPTRYLVSARRFAWQMTLLKLARRNVVSLEDYLRCRNDNRLPPPGSVIITIDDGYLDNARVPSPTLCRHHFPATIFVVSSWIGKKNEWDSDTELTGRALMSREDLLALAGAGIEIGAHTRTHPRLPSLPPAQLEEEVAGSRADLEKLLDKPVVSFSYPYGAVDEVVEAAAQEAGFLGACCVQTGLNSLATPLFQLRRTEIKGNESLLRFPLSLSLGRSGLSEGGKRPRGLGFGAWIRGLV